MNKVIIGVLGAAFGVLPAAAADLPVRAPRAVAPALLWSGCYIGGNAGAAIRDTHHRVRADRDFLLPANAGQNFQRDHDHNFDDAVFTGGGQIGCNYQSGALVLGVEADIQWAGHDQHFTHVRTLVAPLTGTITHDLSHKVEFWGTARGRAGWAFDNSLIYVTGGFAWARVEAHTTAVFSVDGTRFDGSGSDTRTGWTVGAGWEYAWTPNWSIRGEYLFVDLGSFSHNAVNVAPPARPGFAFVGDVETRFHVARAAINYRWGAAPSPVVARY